MYDMITWVVQKSDVRLFRAVGSIIRQMIKTGIADKFKVFIMIFLVLRACSLIRVG